MSRQKSQRDIRSRIKHENVHLGGGAELGGGPAPKPARQPWEQHGASYSTVSTSSIGAPMMPRSGSSNDVNGASSSSNNTASAAASAIAAANLGAGPSFVSLSPSDSISNFEGRAGTRGLGAAFDHAPMGTMPLAGMLPTSGQRSGGPGLFEPSAGSTASFAQNLGAGDGSGEDGSTPLRPARSQRRPLQAPSASPQDGFSRTPSSRRQQYAGAATDAASSSVQAVGRNLLQATHGQSPSRGSNTSAGDRHARSARLMAEVASGGDNGRATPNSWTRAGESADEADFDDVYGGMDGGVDDGAGQYANNHRATLNVEQTTPTLGSLTRREEPAALGSVLSALSAAGRKQGAARILRGTTAEEESRRRKRERKVEDARGKEVRPLEHYVDRADEKAFREICAVLRKVKAEWGFIVDDDFNYVSLALSLLDDSSLGSNRNQFSEMQKLIEGGLQGTVDDHHESFATAISLHSNVLSSLTSAQTSISGARRRLRDSREALGAKRADLVQLWHRSQGVKESLRLLDTIELLKGVPDRLESLMSEKRFLEAVNVLMHSLKQIDKTDIVEVGATADLRGYLKGQEQAMFDILIEELHNHLYLKSFFCDARWKAYSAGQSTLPNVEFGSDYQESQQQQQQFNGTSTSAQDELGGLKRDDADQQGSGLIDPGSNGALSTTATGERPLQVFRFINALSTRPAYDPNLASDMANLGLSASGSAAGLDPSVDATMATSKSADSNLTLMGSGGAAQAQTGGGPSKIAASSTAFEQNPEADSFLYIEMLLESLARLGKLRLALDIVAQRLPIELHQLVEATIDEVDERNEPLRRSSVAIVRPESLLLSSSSALARSFAEGARSSFGSNLNAGRSSGAFMSASASSAATSMGPGARTSTVFRLSASETSAMERDSETMRDLFWTLFSKLDAVLQGHRVVYEVATKIMSRDGGKSQDASTSIRHRPPPQRTMAGKTPSHGSASVTNLIEVWKPIQTEVRTLLHEHLMDDSESTSARRNAIVSVNEVLRLGTFGRDKSKQLFKLAETAPRPGVNVSRKDFAPLRRHEEALTAALRASVPGLVGAADTSANAGISAFQQQQHHHTLQQQHQQHTLFSSLSSIAAGAGSSSGPNAGAGHRILVKPDAFNISVLFQPALAFIERVQMILPGEAAGESSKGFSAFLEEFVQDVFLAQLEEKVQTLFQSAVGGPDAFQEDPTSKSALQRPVVKATANVLVLVDSLYSMLRTTPFHRESYSHLVIQTLVQFYQRCHERFRDLVTTDVSSQEGSQHYHLSAAWAQRPELTQCLSEYVGGSCDATRRRELLEQENAFELLWASQLKGAKGGPSGGTIALHDLTTSRKKLTSLGNLHYSLLWFLSHISRLKPTDEDLPTAPAARARLSVIGNLAAVSGRQGQSRTDAEEEEGILKLPLSIEMASRFEAIPRTYRHLSNLVLFTLRLEIRARTIHYLDLAITEGNYLVEDAVLEPDPHVVDLNAELSSLDDVFSDTLARRDHRFLFVGLASLMDTMLCRAIRRVRFINRHGLTKMIRNVLALQQNLRNIVIVDTSKATMPKASGGQVSGGAVAAAGKEERQAYSSSSKPRATTTGEEDEGDMGLGTNSFERSRKLWELVGKDTPEELFEEIRTMRQSQQAEAESGSVSQELEFDDYKCALNLMLGIDNAAASVQAQQASKTPVTPLTPGGGLSRVGLPGANLRPGTTKSSSASGEVSRQKLNEYLIELHEVAL